jgi:hypothetical protein
MRITWPVTYWSSPALVEECLVDRCGQFCGGGQRPPGVAETADGDRGEEGRLRRVAHSVGDRDVEVLVVDRVVEGVAACIVGGFEPPGDRERSAFGRVRGGEQASLDLGGQGEGDVALCPLEEIGVTSRDDEDVRQGVRGGGEVVQGLGVPVGGGGRARGCRWRHPAR